MADHLKALQAPIRFSDTLDLSRREMEALASEASGSKIAYLAQRKKNGIILNIIISNIGYYIKFNKRQEQTSTLMGLISLMVKIRKFRKFWPFS